MEMNPEAAAEARQSRMNTTFTRTPTEMAPSRQPRMLHRIPIIGFIFQYAEKLLLGGMNRVYSRRQSVVQRRIPRGMIPVKRGAMALSRHGRVRWPGYPGKMEKATRPSILSRKRRI